MDAVALTRTLLQFDTINPPGRERDCAHHAGAMLQEWGYSVEYHEYADRRTSVIARAGGGDAGSSSKKPLQSAAGTSATAHLAKSSTCSHGPNAERPTP